MGRASENELQSGSVIGGYQLIESIGRGGEAVVWSAWDSRTEQVMALKALEHSADDYASFQFSREISLLRHLTHPRILTIYDFGEMPNLRYLVSRYLPGGSLARRLDPNRMAVAEIIRIGRQVAEAIDYLHGERVVHRDLKPSNILFDLHGDAYLADFGLARQIVSESTAPVHSQSGTLVYMPPEQFVGSRLSPESDLYSFGVTLFEMLTGALPFAGEAVLAVRQINTGDLLPDLHTLRADLPPEVTAILRRMTAPNAAERPTAAVEAVQQLATALNAPLPVAAPTVRQDEARLLLDRARAATPPLLTATDLVQINAYYRKYPTLPLTESDRAMLLHAALTYGRDIEMWWPTLPDDAARLRIAWETWANKPESAPHLIPRMLSLPPTVSLDLRAEALNSLSPLLSPGAEPRLRGQTLDLLARGTNMRNEWQPKGFYDDVDEALATLALGDTDDASRAAALLGKSRSTLGIRILTNAADRPGRAALQRLADVYETAHGLPPETPVGLQVRVIGWLALRQLTSDPRAILWLFLSSVLSAALCIGFIIYATFRSSALLSAARILNTLGNGLLFGILLGSGIFVCRLLSERLRVLPSAARVLLSMVLGTLIINQSVVFYYQVFLTIRPRGALIVLGSLIWTAGFALSAFSRKLWQRLVFVAGGVFIGLELTWYLSGMIGGIRPPDPMIVFSNDPFFSSALPIALAAAGLAGLGATFPEQISRLRGHPLAV